MPTNAPKLQLRIHPAIGFARLGNSEEFYLAPETSAGMPQPDTETTGGLPIRPGTETETITASDLRDEQGRLKRQAQRFRIFAYSDDGPDRYPNGGGSELRIGSKIGKRKVVDIAWTVHLANKKSAAYTAEPTLGPKAYADGQLPPLRNLQWTSGPADNPERLSSLVIDPGPRAVAGASADPVRFDNKTRASYVDEKGEILPLPKYPKQFPSTLPEDAYQPAGTLDTLGDIRTDEHGRLIALGGYGNTLSLLTGYGQPYQFIYDVNGDGWFDDASDGPVTAVVRFDDGTTQEAHGAWLVCADPAYAPQIRNVVSIWDDVYDTWVREIGLQPEIYDNGFQPGYVADFETQVRPLFRAAALVEWTANIPSIAVQAHAAVGKISEKDDPAKTILAGLVFIRNPNNSEESNIGVPLMPLSLGDSGRSFLSVTKTQYFFLTQWNASKFASNMGLGPGERLDMATLSNCLGGRYCPGIEMSYITRLVDIYRLDWREAGCGPFRIKAKRLDYAKAQKNKPFLSAGWIPHHSGNSGLEPGDTSKFMAIPWQLDYNSCAVHQTSINHADGGPAPDATTLFWSWPAQRPVAVRNVDDVVDGKPGKWVYSVRGPGTDTNDLASVCTFQNGADSLTRWSMIGIVLQGSAIEGEGGTRYSSQLYLETASQLDQPPVVAWPFNANTADD